MPTDWEQARIKKSTEYVETFFQAFDPIVGNFNSNYENDVDRIQRLDPKPILKPEECPYNDMARIFQRMNCFMKVMYEGPGNILIAWGYWAPSTGNITFPETNRLQLDLHGEWRFYRIFGKERERVLGLDPTPYHLAKSLIERLAENSAIPPEVAPSLAL